MLPELEPLDTFYTDTSSSWMNRAIRWTEWVPPEPYPVSAHIGGVVVGGRFMLAKIVEALYPRVITRSMFERASDGNPKMEVWRLIDPDVTPAQRDAMLLKAKQIVGGRYGALRFPLYLLDGLISKARRKRTYFFRRIGTLGRYDVCGERWLSVFRAGGLTFGGGDSPSPEEVHDWMEAHPEKYRMIYGPMKSPLLPRGGENSPATAPSPPRPPR